MDSRPRFRPLQRDLAIAQELERVRQSNQNLEQMLAMDVQYVEETNAGINRCNDDRAAGPAGDHRPGLWELSPNSGKAGGPTSSVMRTRPAFPRPSPRTLTLSAIPRFCHTEPALARARPSTRSTARGRSNRSALAIGSCRRGPRSGQLAFQPVVAVHRNQPAATLRILIGGDSIVATGIHRFWKAGKRLDDGPRAQGRRSLADGRRHGRDRLDRGRQDAARL